MPKNLIILISLFLLTANADAAEDLSAKLSGRILLQAEAKGEAWYINPADQNRYFLGRPNDAFSIMKNFGIGIKDIDLEKIPIGLINSLSSDTDRDGLDDDFEKSIKTDPNNQDSDQDGFDDKTEITNGYNPIGPGKQKIDLDFANKNLGKIFIQTEKNGEAWYVNPGDGKKYYLAKPNNAFDIMKTLGLGISNENITKINIGQIIYQAPIIQPQKTTISFPPTEDIFFQAATAIRLGKKSEAISYFDPKIRTAITNALNSLSTEGMFYLGNIMSGASLQSTTENKKIYTTSLSYAGFTNTLYFWVEKIEDGNWKLTKL